MGKKDKADVVPKQPVVKELYSNYLYPRVEIQPENLGWMKLKLNLIEIEWHFADFELEIKARDPIFYVLNKIEARHGKIHNVKLYRDYEQKEEIKYEFTDSIGSIFKTQGEMHLKDAKSFHLCYTFDINIKSPLLLYEM